MGLIAYLKERKQWKILEKRIKNSEIPKEQRERELVIYFNLKLISDNRKRRKVIMGLKIQEW